MSSVLVTGGTGRLGIPTVARLRSAGHDVRVLSRRDGSGHIVGDLHTGAGITAAVTGVATVVHLATRSGRGDAGFAAGHNLVPGPAYGTATFGDFLADRYR